MKRNLCLLGCLATMLLCINSVNASGIKFDSGNEVNTFNEYKETLCTSSYNFGNITFREKMNFDGNEVYTYCEFKNPNLALDNLKNMYSEELEYLKNTYSLGSLSESNWEDYYNAASSDNNSKYSMAMAHITSFFDTYENTAKNDEVENIITEYNNKVLSSKALSVSEELTDDTYEKLFYLLPDYNNFDSNHISEITPYATQTFNITNGVNYAVNNYNKTSNSTYGYVSGGDCTNFVSQILVAGGYNTVWGLTNRFGWWYNKDSSGNFTYSWSWVNADSFIKYWGIKTATTDFNSFSVSVRKGDFISLDQNNDGDYNHSGFVTGTTTNNITTVLDDTENGICITLTYRNFKIAQHTGGYNLYVNDSSNNWEQKVIYGARYGIVNINKG